MKKTREESENTKWFNAEFLVCVLLFIYANDVENKMWIHKFLCPKLSTSKKVQQS